MAKRRNVSVTHDMEVSAALIATNARPQKTTRRIIGAWTVHSSRLVAGTAMRGRGGRPIKTCAHPSPVSHQVHGREFGIGCLEEVRPVSRAARDAAAQFLLAALEHLRVVRVLDPHVVRRADGRLAVQELPEVLPSGRLPRQDVRHLDREAPADEERLPLVHVPLVEPPFDEARHTVPYVGLMYCRKASRLASASSMFPMSSGWSTGRGGALYE